jgi:carbon storage regulator
MLIIARKPGQSFEIGNNVIVTILEIHSGNQVRIGIKAPKDIRVNRSEIAARIRLENGGTIPGKEPQ